MSQAGIIDLVNNNPQIPTQFDADTGFAIPIANILNIDGSNGVETSASGNTVVVSGINATAGANVGVSQIGVAAFDSAMFTVTAGFVSLVTNGFPWTDKAISFFASAQNGYFCTGLLAVGLPASAGLTNGATIIIYVDTASTVVVTCDADQKIQVGNQISVLGGNATSSAEGSALTLVFRIADLTWHAIPSQGSWFII